MPRRNLESFGSFPASSWSGAFQDDLKGATSVRIASGFLDLAGANRLVEALDAETSVELLLCVAGCSGPEVVEALLKRPETVVRGSKVVEFHWKTAMIEAEAGPVLYVGSANFTSKGLSGRGELMLRLAGNTLTASLWDTVTADFESYFATGTTLSSDQLIEVLGRVEALGDDARTAQVNFEDAIEQVLGSARSAKAAAASRVWVAVWDDEFTRAQIAIIERVLGASPPSNWTRGEVSGWVGGVIRTDDIVIGYQRSETSFIVGRVGKSGKVTFGRGDEVWIADIEHVSRLVESAEHPRVYEALRTILPSQLRRDGGALPVDLYQKVLAVLKRDGLLLAPPPA
jgi:hypothetical protein